KTVLNLCPLFELFKEAINVKKMKNTLEVYPNFLSKKPITTLIYSSTMTRKMKDLRRNIKTLSRSGAQLLAIIWIFY
ncbi:1924_t:CDS:1, partial [Cetraspora pellucida]